MAQSRMQHCMNCGEELGIYVSHPGDLETCGNTECVREARDAHRAEEDERFYRALEDGFSRY